MHPRYSRMLIEASKYGCVRAAVSLSWRWSADVICFQRLRREDKQYQRSAEFFEASQDSGFPSRSCARISSGEENNFNADQCRRYGIHAQSARQVEQTHQQIIQICGAAKIAVIRRKADDSPLPAAFMTGFIDQALHPPRSLGPSNANLLSIALARSSAKASCKNSPLFVVASIRCEVLSRGSGKSYASFLASAVKREWVEDAHSLSKSMRRWNISLTARTSAFPP